VTFVNSDCRLHVSRRLVDGEQYRVGMQVPWGSGMNGQGRRTKTGIRRHNSLLYYLRI
jgi:hypothetical protein